MGAPINHTPDYEGSLVPIPIDLINIWENDIRMDNRLKLGVEYVGLVDISDGGGASSSSSGSGPLPTYNGGYYHPIASIEFIEPETIFETNHNQNVYTELPGRMGGPVMNENNYLTYPGANGYVPG